MHEIQPGNVLTTTGVHTVFPSIHFAYHTLVDLFVEPLRLQWSRHRCRHSKKFPTKLVRVQSHCVVFLSVRKKLLYSRGQSDFLFLEISMRIIFSHPMFLALIIKDFWILVMTSRYLIPKLNSRWTEVMYTKIVEDLLLTAICCAYSLCFLSYQWQIRLNRLISLLKKQQNKTVNDCTVKYWHGFLEFELSCGAYGYNRSTCKIAQLFS